MFFLFTPTSNSFLLYCTMVWLLLQKYLPPSLLPSLFSLVLLPLPRNILLTFYLYFSSFMYKLFSTNLFINFSTISLWPFSISVLTNTSSINLTIFLALMRFQRILFIIVWNIANKFVSLKNITVSSNDPSSVVNATFHSSSFLIHILLYSHLRSIFVDTFFVPIFSIISKIRDKG